MIHRNVAALQLRFRPVPAHIVLLGPVAANIGKAHAAQQRCGGAAKGMDAFGGEF
jgi:hypothetical protein